MNVADKDGLLDRIPILGLKVAGIPLWAIGGSVLSAAALTPVLTLLVMKGVYGSAADRL